MSDDEIRTRPLRIRRHGATGPWVVALHGGPAAVGEAGPIARGLADEFRILEPWQRGSSDTPLTVARHVEDLHQVVLSLGEATRPAIVGHSWGAMLALAYAAAHPGAAGPVALVGCGTFDLAARQRMKAIYDERTDADLQRRLDAVMRIPDAAERLKKKYDLLRPLYLFDPVAEEEDAEAQAVPFDSQAHRETWDDELRLQAEGVHPAAFAAITSPVLMLHGTYDPHPGEMIRDGLRQHIPHLEYHALERCGHNPWLERHARDEFFVVLRRWLKRE
jgi:pimeloyl-ACP methyl ester carboxylesterase